MPFTDSLLASVLASAPFVPTLLTLLYPDLPAESLFLWARPRRRRDALTPLPGRVLSVLREDYRARHEHDPSALRP